MYMLVKWLMNEQGELKPFPIHLDDNKELMEQKYNNLQDKTGVEVIEV